MSVKFYTCQQVSWPHIRLYLHPCMWLKMRVCFCFINSNVEILFTDVHNLISICASNGPGKWPEVHLNGLACVLCKTSLFAKWLLTWKYAHFKVFFLTKCSYLWWEVSSGSLTTASGNRLLCDFWKVFSQQSMTSHNHRTSRGRQCCSWFQHPQFVLHSCLTLALRECLEFRKSNIYLPVLSYKYP